MSATVKDNRDESRFEVHADDTLAGFTDYELAGPTLALKHTEVGDAFEGRGLAKELAVAALGAARESGLAVLPYCQFMAGYIRKHPDYLDLVPADRRAEFDL